MRALKTFLVATLLLSALPIPSAQASFHLIRIREVFAGTTATPDAHYVRLQLYFSGQTLLTGTHVDFFNAAGTEVHTETFTSDINSGANQRSVLIATPQAETLFGVEADLELDVAPILGPGGKVCFGSDAQLVDCVSFGSYSGSATGAGTPFNAPEGIPVGATMMRDISGGSDSTRLDAGDDTNNSANDFEFAVPSPTNNANSSGSAPGATIDFSDPNGNIAEDAGVADLSAQRLGGFGTVVEVAYATGDGTATEGADYGAEAGVLTFDADDTTQSFTVDIIDDGDPEGNETILLRLRNATGNAVFGPRLNATLSIDDDDGSPPDTTAPTSRIARPEHGGTYRPGRLQRLSGTAEDAIGVDRVQIALRMTRTNGSCRWFTGTRFASDGCNAKRWKNATGDENWSYQLSDPLPKSVRTKIRHYTLYSRGTDGAANTESVFEKARNVSRFEIR